jgi:hypothetical protein
MASKRLVSNFRHGWEWTLKLHQVERRPAELSLLCDCICYVACLHLGDAILDFDTDVEDLRESRRPNRSEITAFCVGGSDSESAYTSGATSLILLAVARL